MLDINFELIRWYRSNKRPLPWRETDDPYKIWLSEIILQQTRVAQGFPYYVKFLDAFPDVFSFANAELDDILHLWQGLGYYSRARNMHQAAKQVAFDMNGRFPADFSGLIAIKGIGEYTASAIASFAFNKPEAVVDGNVVRVLSRLFAIDTPFNTAEGKKIFRETAFSILNTEDPASHNQAIMEFGALQCVPANPDCISCPLQNSCIAFKEGKVKQFPVRWKKTKQRKRDFTYYVVTDRKSIYIKKRTGKDIWEGLYEFPLREGDMDSLMFSEQEFHTGKKAKAKHVLSHQVINCTFQEVQVPELPENSEFLKVPVDELPNYAFPRLITRFMEEELQQWND